MAAVTGRSLTGWLGDNRPRIAVVLGSSLSGVADAVSDARAVSYGEVAGFPQPSVSGHGGRVVAGTLGGHRSWFWTDGSTITRPDGRMPCARSSRRSQAQASRS